MSANDEGFFDRELPPELADRFARVGLAAAPTTFGEWIALAGSSLASADVSLGLDAMCTTDRDRHEATIEGETRYFHCVLDTLLLPFVVDGPVTVRSESPSSGEVVEIRVSRDGVTVSPEDAVMSFGIAADVDERADHAVDSELAYETFCPYVNAFASRQEYEAWADATGDAVTVGLTMAEGFALARALGSELSPPDA